MVRRAFAVALVLVLTGCSKGLAGDYTGPLNETCSIARTTNVAAGPGGQLTGNVTRCAGGASTNDFALHVAKSAVKDKLEITVKNCKLVLTAKETMATVDPNQTCTLAVTGYSGKTNVDGSLAPMTDGKSVQLAINFVAAEPGASGAYVLDFHGSPR